MATVLLNGKASANLIGNLGTVIGGSGDASVGTIVLTSV